MPQISQWVNYKFECHQVLFSRTMWPRRRETSGFQKGKAPFTLVSPQSPDHFITGFSVSSPDHLTSFRSDTKGKGLLSILTGRPELGGRGRGTLVSKHSQLLYTQETQKPSATCGSYCDPDSNKLLKTNKNIVETIGEILNMN